jgi:hypothetical protein
MAVGTVRYGGAINMAAPNLDNLSEELTSLQQFCGRLGKQPFIKDPTTGLLTASWAGVEGKWAGHEGYLTFSEARKLLEDSATVRVNINGEWVDRPITGIGFMNIRAEDPARQIVGGDIDCCRNPDTGNIGKWAYSFLHRIQTFYVEVSPSKTGIRFFAMGHLPNDVDSVTGHGEQDDLPASDREAMLAAKPGAREKIAKGKPAFNGVELYVDSRHLTLTGDKLATYCCPPEDCTAAIAGALRDYLVDPADEQPIQKKKSTKKAGSFPPLDILQVIDTTGFEERGGQLSGSHPTEGSTTGANLVVNPGKGVWAYMHDKPAGSAPGGDTWVWLACECGAVSWEMAGAGVLKDPIVVAKTMMHAAKRGLIPETDDIVAAFRRVTETEAEMHHRKHAEANPPWLRADADKFEAEHPGCKIFNCDDDSKQGEISEEEASKYAIPSNPKLVLNLERDNFISQFVAYGCELSDAYPDYWFMGALELLAIINNQKTYVNLRTERVYPNVYLNLLGSSTTSHKSTILKKVAAILERINNGQYHEAPENGSPEGWLEAMSETPRAYCNQDESSGFLNRMKKQDYMSGMTEMLNNCYDGSSFTKRNTKKRKGEPNQWRIEHPYYNQLYATTPSKFSFATSAIDIHSGFWVRFLHAYPNFDCDQFTPLGEASDELAVLDEAVVERLIQICEQLASTTINRATLEAEGWEFYQQWQIRWNRATRKSNDDFLGQIVGRYTIYAIKLGILFTMGRSDFTQEKMIVSTAHIKEACALVDNYFVPHALAVRDLIGEGSAKDANLIIKIETVLRVNGGRLPHREMLRKIKVVQKLLDEALSTMQASGAVTIKSVKNLHGRPTETVFLNGEDNVILSPQDGQYEKHDAEVESKKVGGDNMKETTISKTTTIDRIIDNVSSYCHIVTDEIVNENPGARVGESTQKLVTISIMEDNQDAQLQKSPQMSGDNMGDNMVTICQNRHQVVSETAQNDFSDNMARKDDPGRKRFKAGMKKRHCLLCGQNFSYDLGVHFPGGYICEPCRRDGPPPEPDKADSQKKLGDSEAKA